MSTKDTDNKKTIFSICFFSVGRHPSLLVWVT